MAFTKGTQALQHLVHSLHEAHMNPSLQPMVRVLMHLIIFLHHPTKKALTLLITLLQGVQRLDGIVIGMSHLLRLLLEDVASLPLLIALQRGQESQVIAPRCTQEMAKPREEGISKREEGLPLHPVRHLLIILKSWMHLLSLPQKCIQRSSIKGLTMH